MNLIKFITTIRKKEIYINPEYIMKIESDEQSEDKATILHLANDQNAIYVKGDAKEIADRIMRCGQVYITHE